MHYLLFYEKAPDYAKRQGAFSDAHRAYLQEAVCRGELILGGSMHDPMDGSAILLIHADSPARVEAIAAADPYVVHGIVCRWWVRRWETVIGTAIRPSEDVREGSER